MVTKMLLVNGANYVLMLRGSKYTGISTNTVATRDRKSSCQVAEPHCHFHVLFQLWSLWSFLTVLCDTLLGNMAYLPWGSHPTPIVLQ